MPSRTYIQMWLKLYNMDKYYAPMCEETVRSLIKYDRILRQFPELTEHVVQKRVACFKFCKSVGCNNIPEFILVIYELHIINIWYEQMIKERRYDIKFMSRLSKGLKEDINGKSYSL